jgi:hypothetical protein
MGLDRREFFRRSAQYVLAASLSAVAVIVGSRSQIKAQLCNGKASCDRCPVYVACAFPRVSRLGRKKPPES